MASMLSQLKAITSVVADTGDIEAMKTYHPEDATTNPSLVLKAAQIPEYADHIDAAIAAAKQSDGSQEEQLALACDHLAVRIGAEIVKLIPGRISTEVDARLSFDQQGSVDKAHQLVAMYEKAGVDKSRILIKLASTWEGIRAAEQLEADGINCNLTLLFNFAQARACAEAGVFLISPFVGRILDWYKANTEPQDYSGARDPGVISVSEIYRYFKQHDYSTVVMGASFRNTGEILALAGCDKLTISPALLEELSQMEGELAPALSRPAASDNSARPAKITEAEFRWQLNQDPMAVEKLAEGIRNFAKDQQKLEAMLLARW